MVPPPYCLGMALTARLDAATAAGFVHVRTEHYSLGGRVPGAGDKREASEPVLVFKREA